MLTHTAAALKTQWQSLHLQHKDRAVNEDGFSLLESLIALVVFSVGFLALTALMMKSYQQSQSAYLRSLATEQAYDIADRIRANPAATTIASSDYHQAHNASDPGCIDTSCTPKQMAEYDGWAWNKINNDVLPVGSGSIEYTPAPAVGSAPGRFTVKVNWDDARTGNLLTFTTEFVP